MDTLRIFLEQLEGGRPRLQQIKTSTFGKHPIRDSRIPDLWSFTLLDYTAKAELNGTMFPIRPGYACVMPPGLVRTYFFEGLSLHRFAHFRFEKKTRGRPVDAVMFDTGAEFFRIAESFDEAVGLFATQPMRAEIKLWDILWQVCDCPNAVERSRPGIHPALKKALHLVERRLSDPSLSVAALAREIHVSHNHLTRLFRSGAGSTVVGYIRERRMHLAQHLLRDTDLPVKEIAYRAGIPDLHLFNKTVRRTFGRSPRAVRSGSGVRPS